ncbi:MAG: hypothetical protein IH885_07840 [Myxococcales bacterium]|nr:hypothetical protein [Myxococcales bacterium]
MVAPERERIDAWLKRRETRDRGTAYAEVTLTEDGQVDRILKRTWRTVLGFRVLHDGAIGRLRDAADALRQRFPWSEYQTVQFVLCDTVPRVASLTGTISPANPPLEALFGRQGIPWFTPSLDRISVKVPPTTSPKVVMSFFADLRRSYYEVEEDGRVPGIQKLSEKHAELAVFAFEHNDGRPWREALSAWNETHEAQGWDYSDEKPFARDSRAAYKTVTGRDLGWESGRGPNKRR